MGFIGPRFDTVVGAIFLVIVLVSPAGLMGMWERAHALSRGERRVVGAAPIDRAAAARRMSVSSLRNKPGSATSHTEAVVVIRAQPPTGGHDYESSRSAGGSSFSARRARGRRGRARRGAAQPPERRGAAQARDPVGLPGRVRRVLRATSAARRRRSRSSPARSPSTRRSRAGMDGRLDRRAPIKIVGYGCSNDTAAKAITETKRLMEQLRCRHHDRPAVGRRGDRRRELREGASHEDVPQRHLGRAGHDAQGAGAELLPLQR